MGHPLPSKRSRGPGVIDLELQNKCLLRKWIVNLLNNEGTWQSLLRNKYLSSKSLPQVQAKLNDSHFLRGLIKIKKVVLACGSFEIKNGK